MFTPPHRLAVGARSDTCSKLKEEMLAIANFSWASNLQKNALSLSKAVDKVAKFELVEHVLVRLKSWSVSRWHYGCNWTCQNGTRGWCIFRNVLDELRKDWNECTFYWKPGFQLVLSKAFLVIRPYRSMFFPLRASRNIQDLVAAVLQILMHRWAYHAPFSKVTKPV